MYSRVAERPDDHFYALVGAISSSFDERAIEQLEASEYFMRLCERKGDFSFIYASAPRSVEPGRSWRPENGELLPVLPWHSWGAGQAGQVHPTHVRLDGLCRFTPEPLEAEAKAFLRGWLDRSASIRGDASPSTILELMRLAGFTGCGQHLELSSGYFLPQDPVRHDDPPIVLVATGVSWLHGAPGLVVTDRAGHLHCETVGVFVGPVRGPGASYEIGGCGVESR